MRPQRISVFRCRNQGPLGDASGWHLYDERAWGHHAKPAGKAGVTVAFKGKLGLPRSSNSPVLWAAATTEGPKPDHMLDALNRAHIEVTYLKTAHAVEVTYLQMSSWHLSPPLPSAVSHVWPV